MEKYTNDKIKSKNNKKSPKYGNDDFFPNSPPNKKEKKIKFNKDNS